MMIKFISKIPKIKENMLKIFQNLHKYSNVKFREQSFWIKSKETLRILLNIKLETVLKVYSAVDFIYIHLYVNGVNKMINDE